MFRNVKNFSLILSTFSFVDNCPNFNNYNNVKENLNGMIIERETRILWKLFRKCFITSL